MKTAPTPTDELSAAIGRREVRRDWTFQGPLEALAATLPITLQRDGGGAPLLSHWLYFLPAPPAAQLGPDGHARLGDFLPDAGLPRRMWAAGDLTFHRPLRLDAAVSRRSTIRDVSAKSGRSGRLVFVRLEHQVSDKDGPVLTEAQSIVYREAAAPEAALAQGPLAPPSPDWAERIDPNPVLLFRYSALTFNSHRIHYDRPYAIRTEGYRGLVVHGPLIATLLLHAFLQRRPRAQVRRFQFKAVSPITDDASFDLCGSGASGGATLFARDLDQRLCMEASVEAD